MLYALLAWSWMFLLMAFCHVIEDFHVQGILADLKQRMWWKDNVKQDGFGHRYDKDYIAALLVHGFEWSFFIHLPLMWYTNLSPLVLVSLPINMVVHAVIDDLKCNRLKLNLWQDQLLHLVQIAITASVILAVYEI